MKQLFTLLAITLFGAATWSCSYDDDDLWKEIDGLKTQLAELNKEVSALQTLVDALRQSKTISDVTQTDTGYTITFNDNTSVSIADGKNGTNAPEVGIDLFEGGYYWTIGGKGNWLTDADGHKIPVAGKDGSKPEMAVDADGYWIVDGARGKQIFEKAQQMTLADVKAAQEKWVKGRKYVYGILGDIQDLDLNYLKTLGPIQTVTQEEIFGY